MGRPKKTTGTPYPLSYGLHIKKKDGVRLLEYLGYDREDPADFPHDAGLIISNISIYLGAHSGLVDSKDKAPRPANYIAEIGDPSGERGLKDGLVYDANDLLQKFCSTSYWIYNAYAEVGYELHEIESALGKFIDASCKVIKKMKNAGESRGKPKSRAIKYIINHLNGIFEKYYSIPELDETSLRDEGHEEDRIDGRKLSGKEINRNDFMEQCLILAKIPCPRNWRGLL